MRTHILFIFDQSGSMAMRREATVSGFNEYVRDLKQDENLEDARMTLTTFNTEFQDVFYDVPLADVPELEGYRPEGLTALYDAVGHVLNHTKGQIKKKHRALVVIMTDGEENSSEEFTRDKIFKLIKKYEDKGNYTFVFLGCDQDVWAEGNKIGMAKGNVAAYDGSNMQEAYGRLSNATRGYAMMASSSIDNFWDEDQDAG